MTGDKNVQPTKVQGTNQVVIKTRSLDLKEREALNKALEENFDVDDNSDHIRKYFLYCKQ